MSPSSSILNPNRTSLGAVRGKNSLSWINSLEYGGIEMVGFFTFMNSLSGFTVIVFGIELGFE